MILRSFPFAALLPLLAITSTSAEEAKDIAQVMISSATTTFAGKKVTENEMLKPPGSLKTGAEGGAKVKLVANDVVIEVAANSEVNFTLPPSADPSESIELIKGKVRVRVPKAKDKDAKNAKAKFMLRHKKATMGVRGTDFVAVVNEELDETELVVFEGKVEFANEVSPRDVQFVTAGYWSGLGGRYGEKVRAPIRLSTKAIDYFDKLSRSTPSYSIEKSPSGAQTTSPGH